MKGISIFLNACVAYQSIIIFNACVDELVHQLAKENYDVVVVVGMMVASIFAIGSIVCSNLYNLIKVEQTNEDTKGSK